ncbi:molybdopterin oxidoreductase [Methylobacterium sp. J-077]|uniref:molybdopterin oxidoreductase n=1 Tax=Methylobacterium sp. J-077 TaxID=2836656 RepID=UPI001FB9D811|nr:molybdopterin oxidoreductase [Methylobacterium sp. J-077]MCJ2125894.1 molybdopterin oxidoreductase [Methylobacterium sp. J-077]
MESIPKFLQGVFEYFGSGLDKSALLASTLIYTVPSTKRAQFVYLRAGNSGPELICLSLVIAGKAARYLPIGAKAGMNVPLTIVEDLPPDTQVEVHFSAPEGATGQVVVDVGLLEI